MRVLHPQHAHMLDVKHSLIHLLGHHEGYLMADLSDKQLQMKEENAQNILSIAEKLLPGKCNNSTQLQNPMKIKTSLAIFPYFQLLILIFRNISS